MLIGLVLGLGACELLVRLVFPPDPVTRYALDRRRHNEAMRGQFYEYDPLLGWTLRANARGRFDAPDFSSVVTIDELGHRRQPLRSSERRPVGRVIVLGDSVAFGYGVNDDETFSARLQATHPELEVVNMAVSGYGTDQELLLLRRELARKDALPTTVIVTFYLNDLLDNVSKSRGGYGKPYFTLDDRDQLTLAGQPVPPPVGAGVAAALDDQLAVHLRSYALLRPRITNLAVKLKLLGADEGVDDYLGFFVRATEAARAPRWRMWRALMDRMAAETHAADAKLAVLVVPVRTQVLASARTRLCKLYGYREQDLALEEPEQTIGRWGLAHGIAVVSPLDAMSEAASIASPYFAFDLHPNPLGHRVIATALESLFSKEAR